MQQTQLLRELEQVVEANLNRHQTTMKPWHPHDYIPWDEGKNFAMLGGEDWKHEQSKLSPVAQAAMVLNLLTEDNLPSYHREIATQFGRDGAWGTWVGQWTAEENRHGIVMRDYLVVTRGVDPVALENARMAHMVAGYESGDRSPLRTIIYVTFQELATRISHRNTGKATGDPIADKMLARIAADENLHMIFYRNLVASALEIDPDATIAAIVDEVRDFQMPGANMPNFRRSALLMATEGIYNLRQHRDDVIAPVLRYWKVFERNDYSPVGEQSRLELADLMQSLESSASRFEESLERMKARKNK